MIVLCTEEMLPVLYNTDRQPTRVTGNATDIDCPVCNAIKGQRCYRDGSNHRERAQNARWLSMGIKIEE